MEQTTVKLDKAIARGEQTINEISLRKPDAGALRGISLMALAQCDVDSLIKVLPRITEPTLTENDVLKMDPADLTACGVGVTYFLLQKQDVADSQIA